jgi:hypothetical protein
MGEAAQTVAAAKERIKKARPAVLCRDGLGLVFVNTYWHQGILG